MQNISNFHSHCVFCDGRASMEIFVQYAIAKGLSSYGISSHAPVPFMTRWAMQQEDLPEYLQEFNRLKIKYAADIALYIGLEIDYLAAEREAVFELHKHLPLDYRIGSIHYIDDFPDGTRWNIDGDATIFKLATKEIYGNDVKQTIKRFFEVSQEMIQNTSFDIIGHVDKVAANAASQYPEFNIADKWYNDLIKSVFTLIKEKDIIVEINTKSVFKKGITFPNQHFYRLLKEMNIPIMVNSDCHYPDLITIGFDETYKLLKEIGFKSVKSIEKGKWIDIAIK